MPEHIFEVLLIVAAIAIALGVFLIAVTNYA
ncbi:hypothetical protein SKA34_04680 [Photobacterium sp. SKA34]|nr:hypothetical protein SKA34_04680 [Photobacterium sp. SKA34]